MTLATELRGVGVDVILDKWDLKEGQDANSFMERMVTDSSIRKVILVCDRAYAEKADRRKGGVGTEAQIISPEIYAKADQNKFVAVVTETNEDGEPFLPTYYRGRIHIDLSEDSIYAANFEQLVRWAFDKPLHIKPTLGKQPNYLSTQLLAAVPTAARFRRALETVRSGKEQAKGAIEDYFEDLCTGLETLRISGAAADFDEKVLGSLESFLPERAQFLELLLSIAKYRPSPDSWQQLHRLFENMIPYLFRPRTTNTWNEWDFDNFRFIIHELFLFAFGALLKHECFDGASHLLREGYYVKDNDEYGKSVMVSFDIFRQYARVFDSRNKRLNLRRLSLRADLLKKRSEGSGLEFRHILQADFVIWCRCTLDGLRNRRPCSWWPETLLYAQSRYTGGQVFEIFARAESVSYFESMKTVLGIDKKGDLDILFSALKENGDLVPRWEFESFDPAILLGLEKLATRA
ncbi:MAG: hypothetical protein A2X36_09300 [Elusimicrobia bacterium GWA2_69_24]|nr:MAG: hypothetical protein A2X36_09300 [Elusimicrobia bacterium GWA2_69_24]